MARLSLEHLDVLIVGAGLSGVCAACAAPSAGAGGELAAVGSQELGAAA